MDYTLIKVKTITSNHLTLSASACNVRGGFITMTVLKPVASMGLGGISGVLAAAGVVVYGIFEYRASQGVLPGTCNKDWERATEKLLESMPREGAPDEPIKLNPLQ
ncbi:hypothetical protein H632_c602p1 [Helicosporidium sp. ATCC 50920]|nr:hypothetical protein H632_c602p1 [Helicosporidium sp. ATCC 50920]|eukprot:KDD75591.1 hypothetical protein H632_c602p1 [Helicosporidium sp. ATCC 50920]